MRGVFGFDSALLILKAGGRVKRLAWPANHWMAIEKKTLLLVTDSVTATDFVVIRPDGYSQDFFGFSGACLTLDLLAEDWTAECTTDLPKENE